MTRLAIFSVAMLISHVHPVAGDEALELQGRILAARETINAGILEYNLAVYRAGSIGDRNYEVKVSFKPSHFTMIKRIADARGDSLMEIDEDRILITPEEFTHFRGGVTGNGSKLAVQRVFASQGSSYTRHRDQYLFDPRVLGVAPVWHRALPIAGFESVLMRPDTVFSSVNPRLANGEEMIDMQSTMKNGTKLEFTVLPGKQYFVASATMTSGDIVDHVQSEPQQFGKVWFPRRMIYTRHKGTELASKESYEFTSVCFDEGCTLPSFTLDDLDLPAGYNFMELPPHPGGARQWDGKELVTRDHSAAGLTMETPPNNRWIWASIAIVLGALLSGVALWKVFSRTVPST